MSEQLYALTAADVAWLRRLKAMFGGLPLNRLRALLDIATNSTSPAFRIGQVYGEVEEGTYDGDECTEMGKGEGRLQTFNEDGTLAEPDINEDLEIIYNPAREAIPDGATVLLARDRTITGDDEYRELPGWVAIPLTVAETRPRCILETDYNSGQTLANNTNKQVLTINTFHNFNTTHFTKLGGSAIRLRKTGYYRLVFHVSGVAASDAGNNASEHFNIFWIDSNGDQTGPATPLRTIYAINGASGCVASAVYYYYANADDFWFLQLAAQKVEWTNGTYIEAVTAEVAFLGDITGPVDA